MKIQVYKDYSLKARNTFGVDAKAAIFVEYNSVKELKDLILNGTITTPCLHIGAGSNLLFTSDYKGTILHSCIKGIEVIGEDDEVVSVRVGSGVVWDDFVAYCVEHGWYGAENLSLIPGEVGASAVQNIGAYGVEVKDLISSVETINLSGKECVFRTNECEYVYRGSLFKRPEMKQTFVTYVNYSLSKKAHYCLDYGTIRQEIEKYPSITLKTVRQLIIDIRRKKLPDPEELGNAGSFFINPIVPNAQFGALQKVYKDIPHYKLNSEQVKIPAGWLIEQCGWKGKSLGPVAVYDKQALVLINKGGATGADVVALSEAIQNSVRVKFGIDIYPEVNFVS